MMTDDADRSRGRGEEQKVVGGLWRGILLSVTLTIRSMLVGRDLGNMQQEQRKANGKLWLVQKKHLQK